MDGLDTALYFKVYCSCKSERLGQDYKGQDLYRV